MAANGSGRHPGELAEAVGLAGLLPPDVVLAALAGPGDRLPLPPAEAARAAGFPQGRAGEFAAGRWCAHRALERLGCAEAAIGSGCRGEPCWPEGYTGSITHKPGGAVAVAALAPETIGVDLECAAPLPSAVRRLVLLPAEPDLPPGFPVPPSVAERIVFSAKEAYYKWHNSERGGIRRPGFADVRVRLRAGGKPPVSDWPATDARPRPGGWPPVGGLLSVEPASRLPPAAGAWVCGQRWILTAVWTDTMAGPPP